MSGKYQIFNPGVYLDWEKEHVLPRLELAAKLNESKPEGELGEPITAEALLAVQKTWDKYNPLYLDAEYARKAGFPDIFAGPTFRPMTMIPGGRVPPLPQNIADAFYYANDGSDIRTFKRIFPGDRLRAKIVSTEFTDITVPGSDLRQFKCGTLTEVYNQNDELVMTIYGNTRDAYRKIVDGSQPKTYSESISEWVEYFPEGYTNTPEDWEKFAEIWKNEKIRGSEPLYWEDVNVGDVPPMVCTAPVSYMNMMQWHAGRSLDRNIRDVMLNRPETVKAWYRDCYGNYLPDTALHYGARNIPGSRMVFFNGTACNASMRLLTNYIGDQGLVTRVCWKFKQFFKEMQVPGAGCEFLDKVPGMEGRGCERHGAEGDALIGKGYVTDKYVDDLGRHMIDVTIWVEAANGEVIQVVGTSAQLPTRG